MGILSPDASPSASSLASPSARFYEVPEAATSLSTYTEEAFINKAVSCILGTICAAQQFPHKRVLIGLSGGSTPLPVYDELRKVAQQQTGLKHPIPDFSLVTFFLVDERYIPVSDKRSNQRAIREKLFGQHHSHSSLEHGHQSVWADGPWQFVAPDVSLPLEACISKYKEDISILFTTHESANLVILGLGEDGHIASLFPPLTLENWAEAHDPNTFVMHTTTDRFDVHDRITVTQHVLLSASVKLFLLKGEAKLKTWHDMESDETQNYLRYPALELIRSGGTYVVSYPSLDSFKQKQKTLAITPSSPLNEVGVLTPKSSPAEPKEANLCIVVLGASGDLAKKKTFPALFSLFCEGLLPANVFIIAYARTEYTFDEFWKFISSYLKELSLYFTRQIVAVEDRCQHLLNSFKKRLSYVHGQYDDPKCLKALNDHMTKLVNGAPSNRILYLALPPKVFASSARSFRETCWSTTGWNRVVVEKPFGKDSESSQNLSNALMSFLREDEIYRIDHYLGKEMSLAILTLRFANTAFQACFSRQSVQCVRITFKEEIGTMGRGGYFDEYGIIRDVMQNHMLQLLTLIAMEVPASLNDEDIRDEKVKVLKQIPHIQLQDTVLGQYVMSEDGKKPGYLDDPTVPTNSLAATFCTTVLWIRNDRWRDVPFILKAGKALEKSCTEIRVQMKPIAHDLYPGEELSPNELVILVQPRGAVYLKIYTKKPGLTGGLQETELDFSVMDRFQVSRLPDAYERLLLDVIKGDKQNFVRTDELHEAWRIFTPILKTVDEQAIKPFSYAAGSTGPMEAYESIQKYYTYSRGNYQWIPLAKV